MRYQNTQRLLLLTPSQNTAYLVSWTKLYKSARRLQRRTDILCRWLIDRKREFYDPRLRQFEDEYYGDLCKHGRAISLSRQQTSCKIERTEIQYLNTLPF